jgi:hypothetical protein
MLYVTDAARVSLLPDRASVGVTARSIRDDDEIRRGRSMKKLA